MKRVGVIVVLTACTSVCMNAAEQQHMVDVFNKMKTLLDGHASKSWEDWSQKRYEELGTLKGHVEALVKKANPHLVNDANNFVDTYIREYGHIKDAAKRKQFVNLVTANAPKLLASKGLKSIELLTLQTEIQSIASLSDATSAAMKTLYRMREKELKVAAAQQAAQQKPQPAPFPAMPKPGLRKPEAKPAMVQELEQRLAADRKRQGESGPSAPKRVQPAQAAHVVPQPYQNVPGKPVARGVGMQGRPEAGQPYQKRKTIRIKKPEEEGKLVQELKRKMAERERRQQELGPAAAPAHTAPGRPQGEQRIPMPTNPAWMEQGATRADFLLQGEDYEAKTNKWQQRQMIGQPPSYPTSEEEDERIQFHAFTDKFLDEAMKNNLEMMEASYSSAEKHFSTLKTIDRKAWEHRLAEMRKLMKFEKLYYEFIQAQAACDLKGMDDAFDDAENIAETREGFVTPALQHLEYASSAHRMPEVFTGTAYLRMKIDHIYAERLEAMERAIGEELRRREQKKPCGQ